MKHVLSARNVTSYSDRDVMDMEVEFDTEPGVFIPFAAMKDDGEQYGRDLYERARKGEFGPINMINVDHRQAAEQSAKVMLTDAINIATSRIAPLQDAKELGLATQEELTRLEALQRYRIDLMRLPESEGWPTAVIWPELPQ